MEVVTILLLSICLLVVLNFVLVFYSFSYWKRKGVVYVPPKYPFGNAESLFMFKTSLYQYGYDIYFKLKKLNKRFGRHYLCNQPELFIFDPELIKQILITDFRCFQNRGMHCNEKYDPLNCSIICLSNDRWKMTRGKLSPAFTSGKLKMLFGTFQSGLERLDEALEEAMRGGGVDVRDIIFRAIIDNLGRSVFGLDFNTLNEPNSEVFRISQSFFETTLTNVWLLGIGLYYPIFLDIFKIPVTHKKVSAFFGRIIKQTVTYRLKHHDQNSSDFMGLFIKLMKKSKDNGLSYNEMAAHAFAFFSAGYETSASTITFCLYELSYNTNIQNILRQEILDTLKKNQGELTYDIISRMNYLDKVVCETLRKYPTLSLIYRKCNGTYTIPGSEVRVDPGTGVWILPFALHNDPEHYPNPIKFDPERFSEEEKAKRHPFTYIPFGEGPRVCIGKRFALLQIKLTVIKILSRYELELDPKTEYPITFKTTGIFMSPKNTIWMKIKKLTEQ